MSAGLTPGGARSIAVDGTRKPARRRTSPGRTSSPVRREITASPSEREGEMEPVAQSVAVNGSGWGVTGIPEL
jgi:hypothetical protein